MDIYLDNSATTRPCAAAVEAVEAAMLTRWHNPSALYPPAMQTERDIRLTRERCLQAANAAGQRLCFTSGGTEADNLAILGHMQTVRTPGRVLLLQVEHPAVLSCIEPLRRMGHQVDTIPVTREGLVDLPRLEAMLAPDVHMLCVMQVNNETGAVQPIEEIARLRDRLCPQAAIHVDGVQGFLRVPIFFNQLGIQSYAFSGHKIHAVKGIGGLIARKDFKLSPILYGGGQEGNLRSGTENTPGIAALGAAVASWSSDSAAHMASMKRALWNSIANAIPSAVFNGPDPGSPAAAPHILNVSLPPVRSQTMLNALSEQGIYVSVGSACGSHKQKTSPVLSAMGLSGQIADCALRFSLCPENTLAEIEQTIQTLREQYAWLSKYVRR